VRDAAAGRRTGFSEIAAVAALGLLNVGLNRVPPRWELAASAVAAGTMLLLAHESGADLATEGLDPAKVEGGLRLGLAVGLPAAAVVMAGAAIPAVRRFYHDDRIARATSDDLTYHLIARIPFATAMAEEVIFRSALVGIFRRRRSPVVAALMSSALFGAWHVLPTIDRLHTNPGAARLHGRDIRRQAVAVAGVAAGTAVAGMGFCWLQWRSRSVVAPVVVHAAINGAGLLAGWLGSRVGSDEAGVTVR
jgi:membrane protease YdiL (CAAX protease family)